MLQPAGPAAVRTPGPWLPATLLPGGAAGTGLAVELRLATPPAGAEALFGRVVAGGNGLALDIGGHHLSLTPRLVDLPQGARLPIELRAPAAGDTVADRAGLERLVARLRPIVATPAPVAMDAGLAARLLAEWRRAEGTGRLDLPAEATARPAGAVDVAGGWRSLFDLAGAGSLPVAPVMLRQHRPEPEDPAEAPGVEHLRLVVELSRLGRVAIDLRVDARTLATSLTSAGPLDAGLRAGIGEVYAAAVELAGRTGSLAFRVAPAAATPGPPIRPVDDLTV